MERDLSPSPPADPLPPAGAAGFQGYAERPRATASPSAATNESSSDEDCEGREDPAEEEEHDQRGDQMDELRVRQMKEAPKYLRPLARKLHALATEVNVIQRNFARAGRAADTLLQSHGDSCHRSNGLREVAKDANEDVKQLAIITSETDGIRRGLRWITRDTSVVMLKEDRDYLVNRLYTDWMCFEEDDANNHLGLNAPVAAPALVPAPPPMIDLDDSVVEIDDDSVVEIDDDSGDAGNN
jgi:hypothetical protein